MLRTLFIFAIIIPGTVAALTNRYAGLLLYLWFALFRPLEFTWVDFSYLRLSLLLGIIFVVPSLMNGIRPNVSHPLSIGGLLFFFAALLAQVNVYHAPTGWYWVDFLGRLLLICLLSVTIVNTKERFLGVLAVIAVSFGFHTAKAGLYSLMRGGARFAEGITGAFTDNNGYALGMVMILWLLVAVARNAPRKWMRYGLYGASVLTAFATVATFSRGGFVALCLSTIMFVVLQRRRAMALTGIAVLLAILPFVPLPEGYTDRLQTIQTYEEVDETSALSRLHFWKVAVAMASANPIGVGLFNYEFAYNDYDFLDGEFGRRRSVHSSFFQVLAETGFFGAAVYAWMLVYSLVVVLRIRKRALTPGLDPDAARLFETASQSLGASMVGFIGGGSFIALALNDLTWLMFAMLASLDILSARAIAEGTQVSPPVSVAEPVVAHRFEPRMPAATGYVTRGKGL